MIVLHGLGADGPITETLSGFSKLAEKQGFAVAYPNGLERMWRYWEGAGPLKKLAKASRGDDIGYLTAIIDETHKSGRKTGCHVFGGEGLQNAITAGCDTIEHGFGLTDANRV